MMLKCIFVILTVSLSSCVALAPCGAPFTTTLLPSSSTLFSGLSTNCGKLCTSCVNTVHDLLMQNGTCLDIISNFTNNLSDISDLSRPLCVIVGEGVSLKHSLRLGLGPLPTNNCVTVNGSAIAENIVTGVGDDYIHLVPNATVRNINTGGGSDAIYGKSAFFRNVNAGAGDDYFHCVTCNISGSVELGSGNDTLIFQNSSVAHRISGGSGVDGISLNTSTVDVVDLGSGKDYFADTSSVVRHLKGGSGPNYIGVDSGAFIREYGTDDDVHSYCMLA